MNLVYAGDTEMQKIRAWGASAAGKPLAPMTIERREPGPRDVVLEILFRGVCHSDIPQVRDEWSGALFPMVRGHEIIGRVTKLGVEVSNGADPVFGSCTLRRGRGSVVLRAPRHSPEAGGPAPARLHLHALGDQRRSMGLGTRAREEGLARPDPWLAACHRTQPSTP
jgi:NADPH:quinone reductase-like Zn-dependent oxidoreductase